MPRHHHVNLGVPPGGLDAQKRFLSEVLGYRKMEMSERLQRMGANWYEGADGSQIHLSEDPEHAPPKRAHTAVVCDDGEFEAVMGRLEAEGIKAESVSNTGIRGFMVIHDPSGNRWEIRTVD